MSKPENVLVWIATRESYVETNPGTTLRFKNGSKFGQNNMGFNDIPGELVELTWETVFRLRPTMLEINFERNPCNALLKVLEENYETSQIVQFFEKVKVLSLHMTDVSCTDLISLLKNINLLAAFSFCDTKFTPSEWSIILERLAQLNLRGINVSDNIVDKIAEKLDISLMKLSVHPGVHVGEFKKGLEFVTVKTLVVEELFLTDETDAEQLLEVLPKSFPRLQTLVWDWNVVDPELMFNERTKGVVSQIMSVYKEMKLEMVAIVAYTPCPETKSASERIAKIFLDNKLPNVTVNPFASRGVARTMTNFSLILFGTNDRIAAELIEMYVTDRTTMPPLGTLLRLCEENIVPLYPATVIDFGGFDKSTIRAQFANPSE